MKKKQADKWNQILIAASELMSRGESLETLICPWCQENSLDYQYVRVSEDNRGSLYIWCNNCKRSFGGIRCNVPPHIPIFPTDSIEDKERIQIMDSILFNPSC